MCKHEETLLEGAKFNPWNRFRGIFLPEALLTSGLVSTGAAVCYGQLARYAGRDGRCYPSHQQLAAAIHKSRSQIIRYIRELSTARLIQWRRRGLNLANEYTFLWHAALAKCLRTQDAPSDRKPPVEMTHPDVSPAALPDVPPTAHQESHKQESPPTIDRSSPRGPQRQPPWPAEEVAAVRRHLEGWTYADGQPVTVDDALLGRIADVARCYMRTGFEVASVLYAKERQIQRRPSWAPQSPAWFPAALERHWKEQLAAVRKPAAPATPAPAIAAAAVGAPDPHIAAMIADIAHKKGFPTRPQRRQ